MLAITTALASAFNTKRPFSFGVIKAVESANVSFTESNASWCFSYTEKEDCIVPRAIKFWASWSAFAALSRDIRLAPSWCDTASVSCSIQGFAILHRSMSSFFS